MVFVRDVLQLPVMSSATVVGGKRGLIGQVRWPAVIEWPAEDFVRPGELVLTSGIGCDPKRFTQLLRDVFTSGAAAACVGVGRGRYFETVPQDAIVLADELAIPLIELPWELRFADISRAVVDLVLHGEVDKLASLHKCLHDLAMTGAGVADGVADALEKFMDSPALVLDWDFRVKATSAGVAAVWAVACRRQFDQTLDELTAKQIADLDLSLAGRGVSGGSTLERIGMPPSYCLPVMVERRVVAYVVCLTDADSLADVDATAMEYAALAIATDSLRDKSAMEAEDRINGHFLWALAGGGLTDREQLDARARSFGCHPRTEFDVFVVELDERVSSGDTWIALQRTARRVARRSGGTLLTTRRGKQLLLLLEKADGPINGGPAFAQALYERAPESCRPQMTIGVATRPRPLLKLPESFVEASHALRIARSLYGTGLVADARLLEPMLMLGTLSSDPDSCRIFGEVLRPLLTYDRGSERGLIETLRVYFDENMNTSSAARELYLNRHSMLYRLKKIESLTGKSLESGADRFVLEVSIRLLSFGFLSVSEPVASAAGPESGTAR